LGGEQQTSKSNIRRGFFRKIHHSFTVLQKRSVIIKAGAPWGLKKGVVLLYTSIYQYLLSFCIRRGV
jgi:hypothetical protein